MLKNREWNYAKLKYEKRLEWTLLKIVFDKNGQKNQWEEIEKLCGEWETAFNEGYFVGNELQNS